MTTATTLRSPLRALVTGAAKRVGSAIARALGEHRAHVIVHYYQSRNEAEATRDAIIASGGESSCVRADLTSRTATRKLVTEAVDRLGGLDLLVASAAGYERARWDAVDDEAWDRMLRLNLTSPFVLAQQAAPALRASRGSIVFLTCSSASVPFRNHLPYVVAKGGLLQLTRALALELAPEVRVNAVAPGTVLPPASMDVAATERLAHAVPLQRIGSAEDVAQAVLYLAQAKFVTGHEIAVDGGRAVARVEPFG